VNTKLHRGDVQLSYDLAPFVSIRPSQIREFIGARFRHLHRDVRHLFFHSGQKKNAADLPIKPRDNLLWETGGTISGVPNRHFETRHGFGHGRHIW